MGLYLWLAFLEAWADSPLTSTPFHEVYREQPFVTRAERTHILDAETASLLADPAIPIDIRAAVISALGWEVDKNSERFLGFMAQKKRTSPEKVKKKLTGDEAFAYGYLLALDDYQDVHEAQGYLKKAEKKLNKSYTVSLVNGLVNAQLAFDGSWCEVWRSYARVERAFPLEGRDLRPAAQRIVADYLQLYSAECK